MSEDLFPLVSRAAEPGNSTIQDDLLAAQTQRAETFETMLRKQISDLQNQIDKVADQKKALKEVNYVLERGKINKSNETISLTYDEVTALSRAMNGIGISIYDLTGNYEINNWDQLPKSVFEKLAGTLEADIENLSNLQQLDMLRLQATYNRFNESYETWTTLLKKFGDVSNSTIRNMS